MSSTFDDLASSASKLVREMRLNKPLFLLWENRITVPLVLKEITKELEIVKDEFLLAADIELV